MKGKDITIAILIAVIAVMAAALITVFYQPGIFSPTAGQAITLPDSPVAEWSGPKTFTGDSSERVALDQPELKFGGELTVSAHATYVSGNDGYVVTRWGSSTSGRAFILRRWERNKTGVVEQCAGFWLKPSGRQDAVVTCQQNLFNTTPGVYTHYVATHNGTKMKLFIDGELVGSKSLPYPMQAGDYPTVIGSDANGGRPFAGEIKDVQIFDKSLPPEGAVEERQIEVKSVPGSQVEYDGNVVDTPSNISTNESEITLTVKFPNQLPTATISAPSDSSSFNEGESITFSGSGEDEEDGNLTGSSLQWSSDIDGNIGTGESISTTLSAGNHIINLTATDSRGDTGSDSIAVEIVAGENQPPVIMIKGGTVRGTNYFNFQANATDAEDGQLSGDSIRWYFKDGDDYVHFVNGNQGNLPLNPLITHQLLAEAIDSQGATARDNKTFTFDDQVFFNEILPRESIEGHDGRHYEVLGVFEEDGGSCDDVDAGAYAGTGANIRCTVNDTGYHYEDACDKFKTSVIEFALGESFMGTPADPVLMDYIHEVVSSYHPEWSPDLNNKAFILSTGNVNCVIGSGGSYAT